MTQKEIIYKACERIETGVSRYSCCAITTFWRDDTERHRKIRKQYADFIDGDTIMELRGVCSGDLVTTRILAMLLFLEVTKDED